MQDLHVIILCAGKGSRMKSTETHKVCFPIAGKPAIQRLMEEMESVGLKRFHTVVGAMADRVMSCISAFNPHVNYVFQDNPHGTGHAVQLAFNAMRNLGIDAPVMIAMGDKLIRKEVLKQLIASFTSSGADAVLAVQPISANPSGGRIVLDDRRMLRAIIENRDAKRARVCQHILSRLHAASIPETEFAPSLLEAVAAVVPEGRDREQIYSSLMEEWNKDRDSFPTKIQQWSELKNGQSLFDPEAVDQTPYVNAAVYIFKNEVLAQTLDLITSNNAQGEVYLTDVINQIAAKSERTQDKPAVLYSLIENPDDLLTFNTVEELMYVEQRFAEREKEGQLPKQQFRTARQWLKVFEDFAPDLQNRFNEIYGDDEQVWQQKQAFFKTMLQKHIQRFGGDKPVVISRAPGRVNLMGRHIEHRGGSINVISMNQEMALVAEPRADDTIQMTNVLDGFEDRTFRIGEHFEQIDWNDWVTFIESDAIRNMVMENRGDWSNYVKAAVLKLQFTYPAVQLKGMNMTFYGDIPMAAGLSSSSAIVVSTSEAAVVINDLDLSVQRFVDICGEGEWFVGSRGGAGDHAAMKFGNRGNIAHLGFYPFRFIKTIPFPTGYKLVIANSHVKAQKTTNAKDQFNQRVASYEFGLMLTRQRFPQYAARLERLRDFNPDNLGVPPSRIYEMLLALPEVLEPEEVLRILPVDQHARIRQIMANHIRPEVYFIRSVVLYGIAECMRADYCSSILEAKDFDSFGRLMAISHNGDRITTLVDGKMESFDWRASDEYLMGLINDLRSENPAKVTQAQLYLQPGGYACSTKEIDFMIDAACQIPGVIGAQLSGAGLGGCIMILVRDEAVDALIHHMKEQYYVPRELEPAMFVATPVKGSMVFAEG